jgi:hypothetical protein
LRRSGWKRFAAASEETKREIVGGLAQHEQEADGRLGWRKSKEQANRADLFFGWNRVDKTH